MSGCSRQSVGWKGGRRRQRTQRLGSLQRGGRLLGEGSTQGKRGWRTRVQSRGTERPQSPGPAEESGHQAESKRGAACSGLAQFGGRAGGAPPQDGCCLLLTASEGSAAVTQGCFSGLFALTALLSLTLTHPSPVCPVLHPMPVCW